MARAHAPRRNQNPKPDPGMPAGTVVCQYDEPAHRATLRLTLTDLQGTVLDVAVGCRACAARVWVAGHSPGCIPSAARSLRLVRV